MTDARLIPPVGQALKRTAVRWLTVAMALCAAAGISNCSAAREPEAAKNLTMTPSITYLHLLRNTPFFTALNTDQLRWVIDHSHEWSADAGAVISRCDHASSTDHDYWVLLDGGWQLSLNGKKVGAASGHADPGKWFNAQQVEGNACALVITEHSYVMRISAADMQTMLARGFAFRQHLASGEAYYAVQSGRASAVPAQP